MTEAASGFPKRRYPCEARQIIGKLVTWAEPRFRWLESEELIRFLTRLENPPFLGLGKPVCQKTVGQGF